MREAVWIGDVLDVAQRGFRLLGHARLVEHQVTAHVHDLRHVLDEHRALAMHAPHVVHDQSVSSRMVPPMSGRGPPSGTAFATSSGDNHDGWKCPGSSCTASGWW